MILIIDDDVQLATGLEKFFRYAGLDAIAIRSGIEALSLLHLRKPRLIVLDLDMPGMDGMTLLRAIRQDAVFKDVPILIFTSDISREKETEACAAGAQKFFVKATVGWGSLLAPVQ